MEAISAAAVPADSGEFGNAIHGISKLDGRQAAVTLFSVPPVRSQAVGGVKLDGSELPSPVSAHVLCAHMQAGGAQPHISAYGFVPEAGFVEIHPPVPSQIDRGVPLVLTGECI